jgi:hypothetical protein
MKEFKYWVESSIPILLGVKSDYVISVMAKNFLLFCKTTITILISKHLDNLKKVKVSKVPKQSAQA